MKKQSKTVSKTKWKKNKPKFKLGDLVRTAEYTKVFSEVIVQDIAKNYTQKPKLFTSQTPLVKSTIYSRGTMQTYWDLQN